VPTLIPWQHCGAFIAVLATALAAGCGSAQEAAPRAGVVSVTERDFKISAPKQLAAGAILLRAHNQGPDEHELIVARIGSLGLPLRSDGLTLDEEALQHSEVGVLEPGSPGSDRDLAVKLAPGRYIFFCNMAGHYMGGMHTEVVVQ
jgi:uncharacterized cupredoxin-like copper-binding protein